MELHCYNFKSITFIICIVLALLVTKRAAHLSVSTVDALSGITGGQLYEYYLSKFTDPNTLDSNNNLVYTDQEESDVQLAPDDESYLIDAKGFPVLEPISQHQLRGLPSSDGYLVDRAPPRLENIIAQKLLEQLKLSNNGNSLDDNEDDHQLEPINKPYMPSKNDLKQRDSSVSSQGNVEYIDHPLSLVGHQYVQGGAGEGRQLLGPDGTFENVQVIKSDDAVPSYCDPPNPCPTGYSAEDGCLENFINSASFSREYQVKQQCSCDNEHSLFNCAAQPSSSTIKTSIFSSEPSISNDISDEDLDQSNQSLNRHLHYSYGDEDDSERMKQQKGEDGENNSFDFLSTLARAIQNRFGGLASVRNLITSNEDINKSS